MPPPNPALFTLFHPFRPKMYKIDHLTPRIWPLNRTHHFIVAQIFYLPYRRIPFGKSSNIKNHPELV